MANSDVSALKRGRVEQSAAGAMSADVEVGDRELLLSLSEPGRLGLLERHCAVTAGLRGDVIRLHGLPDDVFLAQRLLTELTELASGGTALRDGDLESSIRLLRNHPEVKLADVFKHVVVAAEAGKQISPRGLAQRHYVQAIQAHDIVFGVGPAGTGKTYLAMATAVAALSAQRVKRIVLTRPAIEAGEKLGFLPGDLAEKVDPYLRPLYDALHDMLPPQRVQGLIERGTIEVAPLAFMRGRTLSDSFIILDEAPNTSIAQMRMLLTRVGLRSKAVITGDVTQVDLPEGTRSGLADAVALLSEVEGVTTCHFSSADVVRHPLVQRIVEAYDERDARLRRPTGRVAWLDEASRPPGELLEREPQDADSGRGPEHGDDER
jgi:phosphate starvation-inducible PhoH-like protein